MEWRRKPIARVVALAAALAVVGSGSGLPMCLTLLAQSLAPCAMQARAAGAKAHHPAAQGAAVVSHPASASCHTDEGGPGCAAGGGCPAGGTAAPMGAAPIMAPAPASLAAGWAPASSLLSFLAPPLAPPPQA